MVLACVFFLVSASPCVLCCQVQERIRNLVTEHFHDDVEVVMRDPILFGDFRMALHEEETRIYEDIQDYEAAKALFQVQTGLIFSEEPSILGVPRRRNWEGPLGLPLSGFRTWLVSNPGAQGPPGPTAHGSDLRDLLSTQTPGLTGLPFFKPREGSGFRCTARLGATPPAPSFIFILTRAVSAGSLPAAHRPAEGSLNPECYTWSCKPRRVTSATVCTEQKLSSILIPPGQRTESASANPGTLGNRLMFIYFNSLLIVFFPLPEVNLFFLRFYFTYFLE